MDSCGGFGKWADHTRIGSRFFIADKILGNLPPNSLKEMKVNVRNALVDLFKSVGGLDMVTRGRKPGTD